MDDGKIAAAVFIYVDDARITGPSEEDCWKATSHAASVVNSLGIQRPPGSGAGDLEDGEPGQGRLLKQWTRVST